MQLRGIPFLPVYTASGVQGFFGEGYWYHKHWKKYLGLTFDKCGFIAKTTTLSPRKGNMPLLESDNITARELVPRCIYVKPLRGIVLNAVGLSGPGAESLIADTRWQNRTSPPFFLSFMSVENTPEKRLAELEGFTDLLQRRLPDFRTAIGLEMNFSCPNTGLNPASLIHEAQHALTIADRLNIPLQCKLNATVPVTLAYEISLHPACDAITMSNTIPWGQMADKINWRKLFGTTVSPLADLGGGGLSGWPLAPIVCDWIFRARLLGIQKPIWACGGIDSSRAVRNAHHAGASGVHIGVAAMLRPWRMRSIIRTVYELFPS